MHRLYGKGIQHYDSNATNFTHLQTAWILQVAQKYNTAFNRFVNRVVTASLATGADEAG
jgi:hypothetical protein